LASLLIAARILGDGLTKVLLGKLQGLRLSASHEEALDGLFSQFDFVKQLKRADKASNAFV
jgi:hypothetical protein